MDLDPTTPLGQLSTFFDSVLASIPTTQKHKKNCSLMPQPFFPEPFFPQLSCNSKVIESQNLGEYTRKVFEDLDVFQRVCNLEMPKSNSMRVLSKGLCCSWVSPSKAVKMLIVDRFDPFSNMRPTLSLVPQDSLTEFWLPLNYFDISQGAKNGCGVLQNMFTVSLVG